MKKFACLFLAVCMAACLAAPAFAANTAVSSRQSLRLNGKAVSCPAYNIGGSNYYKLRDVAQLLKSTSSKFAVSSSDSTKTVYVTTGTAYTAVGGELSANEKGSLAYVSSAWKLSVDKNYVSCSIYNIAGNNYFKLRDLGGAIGFTVGYDKAANCVLITTGSSGTVYSPDMTFSTTDTAGRTVTDSVFKSQKLTMINYWAYWCGPCCGELPDLQKLSVNYASKGLRVIGVFDSAEASDDIAKLNELGITYTNLNYVSAFDKYLNTGYLPTTVFVDQNGKVVSESYIGSKSYSDWSAIVDGLLK